ncbi:hypothetical protein DFJ73DRAFT_963994 [Zopfochytrium polystomum]|nr:hypothetical protein DFJ73DRAFT_963994 [Zopfochytrium polystomum]
MPPQPQQPQPHPPPIQPPPQQQQQQGQRQQQLGSQAPSSAQPAEESYKDKYIALLEDRLAVAEQLRQEEAKSAILRISAYPNGSDDFKPSINGAPAAAKTATPSNGAASESSAADRIVPDVPWTNVLRVDYERYYHSLPAAQHLILEEFATEFFKSQLPGQPVRRDAKGNTLLPYGVAEAFSKVLGKRLAEIFKHQSTAAGGTRLAQPSRDNASAESLLASSASTYAFRLQDAPGHRKIPSARPQPLDDGSLNAEYRAWTDIIHEHFPNRKPEISAQWVNQFCAQHGLPYYQIKSIHFQQSAIAIPGNLVKLFVAEVLSKLESDARGRPPALQLDTPQTSTSSGAQRGPPSSSPVDLLPSPSVSHHRQSPEEALSRFNIHGRNFPADVPVGDDLRPWRSIVSPEFGNFLHESGRNFSLLARICCGIIEFLNDHAPSEGLQLKNCLFPVPLNHDPTNVVDVLNLLGIPSGLATRFMAWFTAGVKNEFENFRSMIPVLPITGQCPTESPTHAMNSPVVSAAAVTRTPRNGLTRPNGMPAAAAAAELAQRVAAVANKRGGGSPLQGAPATKRARPSTKIASAPLETEDEDMDESLMLPAVLAGVHAGRRTATVVAAAAAPPPPPSTTGDSDDRSESPLFMRKEDPDALDAVDGHRAWAPPVHAVTSDGIPLTRYNTLLLHPALTFHFLHDPSNYPLPPPPCAARSLVCRVVKDYKELSREARLALKKSVKKFLRQEFGDNMVNYTIWPQDQQHPTYGIPPGLVHKFIDWCYEEISSSFPEIPAVKPVVKNV